VNRSGKRALLRLLTCLFALLTLAYPLLGRLFWPEPASGGEDSPAAMASIPPLGAIVRAIAPPTVAVEVLLPAGADPHTYEPAPSLVKRASRADLAFCVGAGLDVWAEELFSGAGGGAPPVVLGARTRVISVDGDPHFWLDPVLVRDELVPAVAGALRRSFPSLGDQIQEREERFRRELTALDQEAREVFSEVTQRRFVVLHDSWRYFARRYGLEQVHCLLHVPGGEPSPQDMKRLVDLTREQEVSVVFAEPIASPRLAQCIAQQLGRPLNYLDPLGTWDEASGLDYCRFMRGNIETLARALGQKKG